MNKALITSVMLGLVGIAVLVTIIVLQNSFHAENVRSMSRQTNVNVAGAAFLRAHNVRNLDHDVVKIGRAHV